MGYSNFRPVKNNKTGYTPLILQYWFLKYVLKYTKYTEQNNIKCYIKCDFSQSTCLLS